MSDVDRAQTASVLRMAAAVDPAVGRRFFDAYRAQERLEQLRGLGVGLRVQGPAETVENDDLNKIGRSSAFGGDENNATEWGPGVDVGGEGWDARPVRAQGPEKIDVSDLFREEGGDLGGGSAGASIFGED